MEAHGSLTNNLDKSQDLSLGLANGPASATAFVKGYTHGDPNRIPKPTGDSYALAGANMGLQTGAGGVSVQAAHIPNFGNQVKASANANLFQHNDHKVDVHAFHTTNIPNAGPNFSSRGAGANYSYKDTVGIGASTTHTPMAKMHEHQVGGHLNLHKNPTSSLDLNVGASQRTGPFGRSNWQRGGDITWRKQF